MGYLREGKTENKKGISKKGEVINRGTRTLKIILLHMQVLLILSVAIAAIATPKCPQTTVSNVVGDLNQKQPAGTKALALEMYKKALLTDDVKVPIQNRTQAIKDRLNQITNSTAVNKTQEVNLQIEKINANIKLIEEETAQVNASIAESLKNINETQNNEKKQLEEKMAEIAKERALIDALNKKKEELRKKTIDLLRLKVTAEKIIEHHAEQMRERRRFIKDLESSKRRVENTKKALEVVKEQEQKKRIAAMKKAKILTQNLRDQDTAQEMKERMIKLKQDRLAEIIRRKMLILQEQIKTAKIQNNEEQRVALEKKLLELKRYKKAKIHCARNALRKYKLVNQKKIEDLKQKVLDTKLANRLTVEKNDYLTKIKAELADEIDELKKQKTAFETEKTIEEKTIDNQLKIESENLKAAQKAQVRKDYAYKNNRIDLAELRNTVLNAEKAQLERKAAKKLLKGVISSTAKQNAIDNRANLDIALMKAETSNKKKILKTIANGTKSTVEAEKAAVEALKNAAVKAKQERQIFKTQIARDILVEANQRHLKHLKERKAEIEEIVKQKVAERNRKAALKVNKADTLIALAGLQGKLDKKYILRRQQVALKNAQALSNAVKGLVPEKKDQFLKLKSFKVNCGSLAKKMSTPCSGDAKKDAKKADKKVAKKAAKKVAAKKAAKKAKKD
ncbi:DNA double-strand break repair Rad50 ATPase, putative [Entamoeba invadens IP1]|uniref:DNA double-strand break repair Rad50 ATPase, putative n=1 Tax=Entamoeba invadens IP1 TaxID=370355 RepID=A0A0A1UFH3_ENTIV|nr:DNA double-strand break repair Rad50 ATPase, putative [Entamoeba invadens IP1]ELP95258.1 DNA double-strand break repair Rad50 ATPase, putative [Entamoeba invadens IP1]|eukprot:XP_004262029.1 DNA double-strand break repair Rad50 ATPase, putative [Entamoeba invadens IP1]